MYETLLTFATDPNTQSMLVESGKMFVKLFVELTLLFLVISYLVALLKQRLPAEKIQKLLGARKGRGYLMAAGLGAITPFCSCSTIPMLIGLLRARAGFGPTMTFLFTSPLLNPIVIALFIPVLGLQTTLVYAALALSASLVAGVVLQRLGFDRFVRKDMLEPRTRTCATDCDSGKDETCCRKAARQEPTKWREAWQETLPLFLSMFPYMVIAMLIGALVHGFVPADFFAEVASSDNPAAVPTAALIGIPLYMRVTALLPLVGPFAAKGVSMGAIIALVIGSGGASLPEVILLKRLFYWPLIIAFLSVIFFTAVIGGVMFNQFFG